MRFDTLTLEAQKQVTKINRKKILKRNTLMHFDQVDQVVSQGQAQHRALAYGAALMMTFRTV